VLLGGLFTVFAGGVDTGAVKFAHGFQLVVNVAMTTNIIQYVYSKCSELRGGPHFSRWMPFYLMLLASVLMILQPLSIFIMDSWGCAGQFTADQITTDVQLCTSRDAHGQLRPSGCSGYYEMDGSYTSGYYPDGEAAASGVSAAASSGYPSGCSDGFNEWMGTPVAMHYRISQLVNCGLYTGFACMFVALLSATGILSKLRRQWGAVRA